MLAIKGRVIDAAGSPVREKGLVVVEGNTITAVCNQWEYSIPEHAEVIEVADGTVMPGLIDLHVHLAQGDDFMKIYLEHPYHHVCKAVVNMERILQCGFTSIRECGGLSNYLKAPWSEGLIRGPRICSAGRALTQVAGGHHDYVGQFPVEFADLRHYIGAFVCGADDARSAVRMNFREGADFVKIYLSSPGGTPGRRFEFQELSDEELHAIVDEAENFGTYAAAHVHSPRPIKAALRCGVKSIEHGTMLDEEDVEEMLKKDAWLVPTLATGYVSDRYYRQNHVAMSPEKKERLDMLTANRGRAVRLAHKAGVKIGCGCDFGGGERTPFGHNGLEVQLLAECGGLSPMEAIVAATRHSADMMLRGEELGTLEPGKLADIIVLKGNPLEDISLVSQADNVRVVVQDGKIVKQLD